MTSYEEWRAYRESSVTGFLGDLSLVALHALTGPAVLDGLPGLWTPAADGGLLLTAQSLDGISVDDVPVDGTIPLIPDQSVVTFAGAAGRAAQATSQPGSEHLLAVWDDGAEPLRLFAGLSAYPYDAAWVLEAEFQAAAAGREMAFSHTADDQTRQTRQHRSPGDLYFSWNGVDCRMTPFASGSSLILVFADGTSGEATYGRGRMLIVPEAGEDGRVRLDFNRAFLPPCAFSSHFNCPLPPANNRLPFPVTAGEQQVLRKA